MPAFQLRKLAVFGVGLIGGSFASALKQAGAVQTVCGIGRSRSNLERAVELGVIDDIASDVQSAMTGADLVLVAVPVAQTGRVLREIAPHLSPDCVVTDAGSTKQDVATTAQQALGAKLPQFVPAHPIAGAELSGVEAASPTLFRGKLVVLTPLEATASDASGRVESAWQTCGARVMRMTPKRHDEVFAAVSHLPHALAFALVEMIAKRPDAQELFSFAGAGFRDFTRIAGSSPEMWRDICLANREALLNDLNSYQTALATLAEHIRSSDGSGIEALFRDARTARNHWINGGK
jgi:prephenate dehydrogenase